VVRGTQVSPNIVSLYVRGEGTTCRVH
jgi:hypothetical protein